MELCGSNVLLACTFAALTSSIALTESAVSTFEDELGWSRKKSTVLCGVIMIALGSLSSLGYGPLANVKIIGMQFLDFFDFLTNSVMMPIAAIATCLFVSRVVGVKRIEEEVTYGGGTFKRRKSLSVYDTVSVSDFCWNHFIKLCRKCIWMDFHVNAFAIGRNLFFQHSIMLFHVSTEDGIFIAQFLKGFDRFFRSEIITADDIERSFLIRESS